MTTSSGLDLEAARRVLEQAAVQQRVPRPRLGEWWRDVLTRIAEFLAGVFDLSSATVRSLLTFVSWGLIALAAVVLVGYVGSVFWRRRAARAEEPADRIVSTVDALDGVTIDWELRLREALERRDVSAALQAQWQVLFARLRAGATAVSSSQWTTRALVRRLGASSEVAMQSLRRLERWTYGGQAPDIEDLRGLRADFESVLPRHVGREA